MQQWSFTGCVCVCVCVCVRACALSRVQPFVTPRTVTHQASLSMGFPRQESWSGLPFPTPGNLPNPGMEPRSPALAGGFSATEPPGKPKFTRGSMYVSINALSQITHPPLPPLRPMSTLYVCASIPALQTASSAPFSTFQRLLEHTHISGSLSSDGLARIISRRIWVLTLPTFSLTENCHLFASALISLSLDFLFKN